MIEDDVLFRVLLLEPKHSYPHRSLLLLTCDKEEDLDMESFMALVGAQMTKSPADFPLVEMSVFEGLKSSTGQSTRRCLTRTLRIFILQVAAFSKRMEKCGALGLPKQRYIYNLMDSFLKTMVWQLYRPFDISIDDLTDDDWFGVMSIRQQSLSQWLQLWLATVSLDVRMAPDDVIVPPIRSFALVEMGVQIDWDQMYELLTTAEFSGVPDLAESTRSLKVKTLRSCWSRVLTISPDFSLERGLYRKADFCEAGLHKPDLCANHQEPSTKFRLLYKRTLQNLQEVSSRLLSTNSFFCIQNPEKSLAMYNLHLWTVQLDECLDDWLAQYGVLEEYRQLSSKNSRLVEKSFDESVVDEFVTGHRRQGSIVRPRQYDTNKTVEVGKVADLYGTLTRDRPVHMARFVNLGVALREDGLPDYRFTSGEAWLSTTSFLSVVYLALSLFNCSAGIERMICDFSPSLLTAFHDLELIFNEIYEKASEEKIDLVAKVYNEDDFNLIFLRILRIREKLLRGFGQLDATTHYYSMCSAPSQLAAYSGLLFILPFLKNSNNDDCEEVMEHLWRLGGVSYVPSHIDPQTTRPGEVSIQGCPIEKPSTELSGVDFAKLMVLSQQTTQYCSDGYVDYGETTALNFQAQTDDILGRLTVPADHRCKVKDVPVGYDDNFGQGCLSCVRAARPKVFYWSKTTVLDECRATVGEQLLAAGVPIALLDGCLSPDSPLGLEKFRKFLYANRPGRVPVRHHISTRVRADQCLVRFHDTKRPSNSSMLSLAALMISKMIDTVGDSKMTARSKEIARCHINNLHGCNLKVCLLVARYQDLRKNRKSCQLDLDAFISRYEAYSNISLAERTEKSLVAAVFSVIQALGAFLPSCHSIVRLLENYHGKLPRKCNDVFIGDLNKPAQLADFDLNLDADQDSTAPGTC